MFPQLDRLSDLPDDVLYRVLSFLPMRCTVQTCLLSKRWKNLWISTPYLHLDFKEFFDTPVALRDPEARDEHDACVAFAKFASSLMTATASGTAAAQLAHDPPIISLQRFRLHWNVYLDAEFSVVTADGTVIARTWFDMATARAVKEIDLDTNALPEFYVVDEDFLRRASSVEVLKLASSGQPTLLLDDVTRFHRLRVLHISSFIVRRRSSSAGEYQYALEELISRCPCLEDLSLQDCFHPRPLCIHAPNLRRLAIYLHTPSEIKAYAPRLRFFYLMWDSIGDKYVDGTSGQKKLGAQLQGASSCLEYAKIDVAFLARFPENTSIKDVVDCLGGGIHALKSLTLTILPRLAEVPRGEFPWFSDLRILKLRTCFRRDTIDTIMMLLLHSPRLETLEVTNDESLQQQQKIIEEYCTRQDWSAPEEKDVEGIWEPETLIQPSNCLQYLRNVKIMGLEGRRDERRLIKFLRVYAKALKKATIISTTGRACLLFG